MPNASISLPTAHTMASIDPVSSSTFQGRRDKWYTTHDTSSTRSPFENDVLFGQIHTNTRKHACPTRSSALNELKHARNTNQVVYVSIFRQETRYTTRAPRHHPFENYVLFGQMHAINGVLTRTSDVLIWVWTRSPLKRGQTPPEEPIAQFSRTSLTIRRPYAHHTRVWSSYTRVW